MAIIRATRQKINYSVIPNSVLRDTNLSFRDRGLLAWMLSHADGYSITIESAARAGHEGKDAIRACFTRLEKVGYINRVTHRDALGHIRTTTYVYDTPQGVEVSDVPNVLETAPEYKSTAARIVAEVWEPRTKGKTAQLNIAVVKIVGSALHNGIPVESIVTALTKIAERGETVTIDRLNKYINGSAIQLRGHLAADNTSAWNTVVPTGENGELAL
jgi:hypothetical protein